MFSEIDETLGNISIQAQLVDDNLKPAQLIEFIRLLGTYVFDEHGFRRLELNINAAHKDAIRISQALGFKPEVILRKCTIGRDRKAMDCVCLSMMDVEWKTMKG